MLVRPELLAQLGRRGRRRPDDRLAALHDSRRDRAEPGRRLGAFSLGPRVFVDLADLEKTGLMGFGSRAAMQRLLKVPDAAFDKLVVDLRADFANEFARVRSYKATEDDIGEDFDARRELPEPGRPGDRDSRRHRRLERHARVRAAEDEEHRHPQVRRRTLGATARGLRGAGGGARPGRQPARRDAGRARDAGDPVAARRRDAWRRDRLTR